MAWWHEVFPAMTQEFDNLMAYKQSPQCLQPEVSIVAQTLDDSIACGQSL